MNQRLSFSGGDLVLPVPTQADLLLSARQWAQRAKDELSEMDELSEGHWNEDKRACALSALDHAMRALAEAAA